MASPPPLVPAGPSRLGARGIPRVIQSRWASDLLDDASEAHEAVLAALHARLLSAGIQSLCSGLIDLAWSATTGTAAILEAKSLSGANEGDQVMAAFAQLRRYRFLYRDDPMFSGHSVEMWVVLSAPPGDPLTQEFLAHEGIRLAWLEGGMMRGPDSDALPRAPARVRARPLAGPRMLPAAATAVPAADRDRHPANA